MPEISHSNLPKLEITSTDFPGQKISHADLPKLEISSANPPRIEISPADSSEAVVPESATTSQPGSFIFKSNKNKERRTNFNDVYNRIFPP